MASFQSRYKSHFVKTKSDRKMFFLRHFSKRLSDSTKKKRTRFAEFFKQQHTIFQQLLFHLHIWQTKASNGLYKRKSYIGTFLEFWVFLLQFFFHTKIIVKRYTFMVGKYFWLCPGVYLWWSNFILVFIANSWYALKSS